MKNQTNENKEMNKESSSNVQTISSEKDIKRNEEIINKQINDTYNQGTYEEKQKQAEKEEEN